MSDGDKNEGQESAIMKWKAKHGMINEEKKKFSCTDSTSELVCCCILLFLGAIVFYCVYDLLRSSSHKVYPFKLEVISLELTPTQISEIHNYMPAADLNLTLSFTSLKWPLLIEPSLVSIKYGDEYLSSIKTDALYLEANGNKSIVLDTGFNSSQLKNTTTIESSMANDLAINHALELTLSFRGRFWILQGMLTGYQGLEIVCEVTTKPNFLASNSTTPTMIDAPTPCKYAYTYGSL